MHHPLRGGRVGDEDQMDRLRDFGVRRDLDTAPSYMNAVLSAVNACARSARCAPMLLERVGGLVPRASRDRDSDTPAGSAPSFDSSGAKRPFTNTSVCQPVAPNVNGASSSRVHVAARAP